MKLVDRPDRPTSWTSYGNPDKPHFAAAADRAFLILPIGTPDAPDTWYELEPDELENMGNSRMVIRDCAAAERIARGD